MPNDLQIFGFDLLFGEGTPVAGSPPTDLKYTGNVRSILDISRVMSTPFGGVSPTRIIAAGQNAEFAADGRIILILFQVGSLSKWLAIGDVLSPEVCTT